MKDCARPAHSLGRRSHLFRLSSLNKVLHAWNWLTTVFGHSDLFIKTFRIAATGFYPRKFYVITQFIRLIKIKRNIEGRMHTAPYFRKITSIQLVNGVRLVPTYTKSNSKCLDSKWLLYSNLDDNSVWWLGKNPSDCAWHLPRNSFHVIQNFYRSYAFHRMGCFCIESHLFLRYFFSKK